MPVELRALDDDWVGDDEFNLHMVATGETRTYGEGQGGERRLTRSPVVDRTDKLIEPETDENVKDAVDDAIADMEGDEDGLNPGESFSVLRGQPVQECRLERRRRQLLRHRRRHRGDRIHLGEDSDGERGSRREPRRSRSPRP